MNKLKLHTKIIMNLINMILSKGRQLTEECGVCVLDVNIIFAGECNDQKGAPERLLGAQDVVLPDVAVNYVKMFTF